jgi:ABC-type polysaccharide/polyol phosphate transport system ATPase subunit
MNDGTPGPAGPAIRLDSVGKVYRLYKQPVYRLLDLFGLCPAGARYYTEHEALHDVNGEILRGEKVAIIGRNGAGKSTLLKTITGLVRPSMGTIQVNGRISNLLQIGTGFHPEFTGRQNVFASLAHQGIVGRRASELFDTILDFAEVHEYIDQPMKTYSTGMCSRLMFSAAVVMTPDILVVDEILGVGDAYFAHKSFERMREMCSQSGTTLLLVTHDIYSALNLCDRFIWIDRGAVRFDGDGKSAISLYEASIKEQEEQRLRARSVQAVSTGTGTQTVHVLIRTRTGFALAHPLAIDRVGLTCDDGQTTEVPVAAGAPDWHLLPESSLGPPEAVAGRPARVLRSTGSIYHKAEWAVSLPGPAPVASARVRWRYGGSDIVDLRVFTADRKLSVAGELPRGDGWQEAVFHRLADPNQPLDPQKQIDYGTGRARITNVQFLDAGGRDVVQIRHGDELTVRVHLKLATELVDRRVTFVLVLWRQGSSCLAVAHRSAMVLPDGDECAVDVHFTPLNLGSGLWYVNVGVGEAGIYERPVINYFATDALWHHLLAGRFELRILSVNHVDAIHFLVHPATIECSPC